MKGLMAKNKKKMNESRSSEKTRKAVDVLKTYTFPEHGVSVRAVDMPSAKILLEKRLKGEKHHVT